MKKQSTYRLLSGEEDDDIDNHTFYFTNCEFLLPLPGVSVLR